MGRRTPGQELYYMPLNFDEWQKLTPYYTLEEKGALLEACRVAWSAPTRGAPPCTLPDNDAKLEVLLGAHFTRVKHAVLQHFRPSHEQPGYLHCAWLLTWFEQARKRYDARAKGGRASAGIRKKSHKKDTGQPSLPLGVVRSAYAERTQPKPNGVLTPHTSEVLNAPVQQNYNPPDCREYEVARPELVQAMLDTLSATLGPRTPDSK